MGKPINLMKKLLAIFILSLFLLSTAAYAHNGIDDGDEKPFMKKLGQLAKNEARALKGLEKRLEKTIEELPKEKLKILASIPPSISKKIRPDKIESALENFKTRILQKGELHKLFQKREVAKEKIIELKANLKAAKSKFSEMESDFKSAKSKLSANSITEDLKSTLLKSADLMANKLERLMQSVESSAHFTQETVDTILSDINSSLSKISELKSKIESSQSKDELKSAARELRDLWPDVNMNSELHTAKLLRSKSMEILKRAERLELRFAKLISLAEENNLSVAGMKTKQDQFSEKLTEARDFLNESLGFFLQAKQANLGFDKADVLTAPAKRAEIKNLTKQSIEASKQAHEKLKQAHIILRDLAKQIFPLLKNKVSLSNGAKPIDSVNSILDPEKPIEGVDIEEGQTTVEVAEIEDGEI